MEYLESTMETPVFGIFWFAGSGLDQSTNKYCDSHASCYGRKMQLRRPLQSFYTSPQISYKLYGISGYIVNLVKLCEYWVIR